MSDGKILTTREGLSAQDPLVTTSGEIRAVAFEGHQSEPALIKGRDGDGATAIGCIVDCDVLANSGAKLLSVRNGGVEKAYFDVAGNLFGPNSPSYGGMFVSNESAATVALTAGGTFYPIVASMTAGTLKGAGYVTFDTDHLVIGASGAGVYLCNCSFSGILSAADVLDVSIFIGSTIQQNIRSDQTITNQTSYASGAITGLLALVAGDTVSVRAACDGGTKTLQMRHMNLTLLRVG